MLGQSRTQKFLGALEKTTDWKPVQVMVLEGCPVGKSEFGNGAYPPLILLKTVLLQKWFGIDSDPDLENQINDRLSFEVLMACRYATHPRIAP